MGFVVYGSFASRGSFLFVVDGHKNKWQNVFQGRTIPFSSERGILAMNSYAVISLWFATQTTKQIFFGGRV